jgi:hypothetical protein
VEPEEHEDTVFDDLWNDPPECSVEFPFWSADANEVGLKGESVVAPLGIETLAHTEASWELAESPCTIPSPSISPFVAAPSHVSPPISSSSSPPCISPVPLSPNILSPVGHCSTSSSPLPRSSASSGSGAANSDDESSETCAPTNPSPVPPQLESDGAANALVPVVVALVKASPASSIDSVTDMIHVSSPSVRREEIRRMVATAVTMEQLQASSLLQLIRCAMVSDPSGNAAFNQAQIELIKALARPSRRHNGTTRQCTFIVASSFVVSSSYRCYSYCLY